MKAFIFAAGIGSRLRPLTDTMPKALVPLCGKPLIQHVIDNLKSQGVTDFVVNVHHFATLLTNYIAHCADAASIAISDESECLLDTGGAIKHAAQLLVGGNFLIHNVDIVSDFDLSLFLNNVRPEALATLLVSERKTSRYLLFDNDYRLMGWTNVDTGEVKSPYKNIDVAACRRLAFSGIHYLSARVTELMSDYPDCFSIIDFYIDHAARYPIYGYVQPNLHLIDVGKPDALARAEQLLQSKNVF